MLMEPHLVHLGNPRPQRQRIHGRSGHIQRLFSVKSQPLRGSEKAYRQGQFLEDYSSVTTYRRPYLWRSF